MNGFPACVALLTMFLIGATDEPTRRTLIERALDERTSISLDRIRLADAMDAIGRQTGVRVVMTPEVMSYAPHGGETMIQSVQINGIPLRQGLHDLLAPLGMQFEVREDHVEVIPRQAVRGLGRAPTWEELDLLAALAQLYPGSSADDRSKLTQLIQFRVKDADAPGRLNQTLESVGSGSGEEALTIACGHLGWSWHPSGPRIVVVSRVDQIRRFLQQPISLRLNNRPLIEVLNELADAAGVPIRTEPGAVASLPLVTQKNFSLNARSAAVELVLERISAESGLGYLIDPDGILFYGIDSRPDEPGRTETRPLGGDPYVMTIHVTLPDGTVVDWLVRRSELPPELLRRREDDIRRHVDMLLRATSSTSSSIAPTSDSTTQDDRP